MNVYLHALLSCRYALVAVAVVMAFAAPAFAEKVIWQYDDLSGDMITLADGLKKHPMSAHPGFVKGEAFGQVYKPKPSDYPVKILSVELVMAAAEKAVAPFADVPVTIEIYNDQAVNAAPDGAPVFSVTSGDFFNAAAGATGMNVQGNTGMIYEFDWSKPENHPPEILSGNIRVVIRVMGDAQDSGEYWEPGCSSSGLGLCQCAKQDFGMGLELCGCQKLAALTDSATTGKANVLHIVYPLGTCSGTKKWVWLEDVAKEGKQMKGDFLLRLGVDGVPPVVDQDTGSQGDTTSTVDTGVVDAAPPAKPVVLFVSPAAIEEGKLAELEIVGENFLAGAKVSIGATDLPVSSVAASKIIATIKPGIAVGVYPVVVENPGGQVGYKDNAFTVTAKPAADVSADVAPVDAGVDSGTSDPGPLSIDLVDPKCVSAALDTQVTIFGTGFVDGMAFELGGKTLIAVNVETPSKASALVPKGLPAGFASLVANRGGKSASLANAVEVGCNAAAPARDAGCSAGVGAATGSSTRSLAGLLVAAAAAMLLLWRRRSAI